MSVSNYTPKHEDILGSKISAPSFLTWTGITMTA